MSSGKSNTVDYLGKIDGRETEWTIAQRSLGNLPDLESTNQNEKVEIDTFKDEKANTLKNKGLDDLDELEDLVDSDLLEAHRSKLLQKLKHQQKQIESQRFGDSNVRNISASDWKSEVTDCQKGIWVIINLFATGNPQCDLVDQILSQLSKRHPKIKFLRIKGSLAIKNFPDSNCPCVLVYKDGEMVQQYLGFGQGHNVDTVEWALYKAGIMETNLKEDPNKKLGRRLKDGDLKNGWKKTGKDVEDDDDDDDDGDEE